jgi:WD40 repeat protein
MIRLRFLHLFAALLSFQAPYGPTCAKAQTPPATRSDANGDPLPAHALARLGSARFRHAGPPMEAVYSPNGKLLASWVDRPETIYVWDSETGKELYRFVPPKEGALFPIVAFTTDGKYFGGYRSIWDVKTGKEMLDLDGDFRAFSEDGRRVVSLDWRTMHIWDVPNCKKLRDIPGQFLALSKDGKYLTALAKDKVVVCDAETGRELHQLAGKFINHFAGQIVATLDEEEVRLWDTATGKQSARIPRIFAPEEYRRHPWHSFSGDGKQFAGFEMKGDFSKKVTIWDTTNGKKVGEIVAPGGKGFAGIQMAPDGKTAITNTFPPWSTTPYLWDVAAGTLIYGRMSGSRAAYAPDCKQIASIDGHAIRIWDAATAKERVPFSGPVGAVRSVSFSADGNTLVAGYDFDSGTFRTWDVASCKDLRTFNRDTFGKHKAAAFAPDGKSLLLVQADKLDILNLATGKQVSSASDYTSTMPWLSFGPDGKNITALELRQLNKNELSDSPKCEAVFRFLNASTGRDLPEQDRPRWAKSLQRLRPDPVSNSLACSISADFRLMSWIRLSLWGHSLEDHRIHLCDIATGKELPAVERGKEIRAVALSPDSRLLATVAQDRRLRLWDIAANKEVANWPGPHATPTSVAFRPDGKAVAVGYSDTTVLLWEVPGPSEPVRIARDDLERLWSDLASAEPAPAYRAMARLRAEPKAAVELFKDRLRPVPNDVPANVAALVADLDDPAFNKREAASAAIPKLGQDAVSGLRSALAKNPSAECRERAGKALAILKQEVTAAEDVRRLRAMQVLEQIGDAASIELLKTMSDGPGETWVTQEAKESLFRLTSRRR